MWAAAELTRPKGSGSPDGLQFRLINEVEHADERAMSSPRHAGASQTSFVDIMRLREAGRVSWGSATSDEVRKCFVGSRRAMLLSWNRAVSCRSYLAPHHSAGIAPPL